MLDWLRQDPRQEPVIELAGRALPVQIRRNARARRLTLRLAPDGESVLVTLPRWTPTREGLAFAHSRAEWLERQMERVPVRQTIMHGSVFPFRGQPVTLHHEPGARRKVRLETELVIAGGPAESLQSRVARWLKDEALTLVASDLAHYCTLAGHTVPPLSLSSAQRRWGSCSSKGVVRINWRLVMAPDPVRRSVVAHEVAHLSHFDHSPRFKTFLDELYEGEIAATDRWLKREGRSLYSHFG